MNGNDEFIENLTVHLEQIIKYCQEQINETNAKIDAIEQSQPTRLEDMRQYWLDRERFTLIFSNYIDADIFDNMWCDSGTTDSFHWWQNSDEYYIVHMPSGMMVNWYKHLGRMNTCSQPWRNETDFKEFCRLLAEEINNLYPF